MHLDQIGARMMPMNHINSVNEIVNNEDMKVAGGVPWFVLSMWLVAVVSDDANEE